MVQYFSLKYQFVMETKKTPMELMKEFAPEFPQYQMNDKTLLFENEKYQADPKKYKL